MKSFPSLCVFFLLTFAPFLAKAVPLGAACSALGKALSYCGEICVGPKWLKSCFDPCKDIIPGFDPNVIKKPCDEVVPVIERFEKLKDPSKGELTQELTETLLEVLKVDRSALVEKLDQERQKDGRLVELADIGLPEYFGLVASIVACGFGDCNDLTDFLSQVMASRFEDLIEQVISEFEDIVNENIQNTINEIKDQYNQRFEAFTTNCDPKTAFDQTSQPVIDAISNIQTTFNEIVIFVEDAEEKIPKVLDTLAKFKEVATALLTAISGGEEEIAKKIAEDFINEKKDPTTMFRDLRDLVVPKLPKKSNEITEAVRDIKNLIGQAKNIPEKIKVLVKEFESLPDTTEAEFKTVSEVCRGSVNDLKRVVDIVENEIIKASSMFLGIFDNLEVRFGIITYQPKLGFRTDGICTKSDPWYVKKCDWEASTILPNVHVPYVRIITGEPSKPPCTANDDMAPEFYNLPSSVVKLECPYQLSNFIFPAPTIKDNCDPNPALRLRTTPVGNTCGLVEQRTWTATDASKNQATFSQEVRVEDNKVPKVTVDPIPEKNYECDDVPSSLFRFSDNCGIQKTSSKITRELEVCADTYTSIRTLTAVDDCGNVGSATQAVSIVDSTSPILYNVPDDTDAECDAIPVFSQSVVASDNCDDFPTLSIGQTTTPGNCDHNFILTRTWESTDNCGNTARDSQIVTVRDTTKPILSGVPMDDTVECDRIPKKANVFPTDNCDPSPSLVFDEQEIDGVCPSNFTLIRTWMSEDSCLNKMVQQQEIEVQDTTPPVLTGVPEDVTVECDDVPNPANVTTKDNCDLTPSLVFSEQRINGTCLSNYTLIRTWTSEDACSNTVSEKQEIEVQDTTPPVISCDVFDLHPSDTNMRSPVIFQPTAEDNCDESPVVRVDSYECLKSPGKKNRLREDKACKVELNKDTATVFITGGVGSKINLFVSSVDECDNVSFQQCSINIVNKKETQISSPSSSSSSSWAVINNNKKKGTQHSSSSSTINV